MTWILSCSAITRRWSVMMLAMSALLAPMISHAAPPISMPLWPPELVHDRADQSIVEPELPSDSAIEPSAIAESPETDVHAEHGPDDVVNADLAVKAGSPDQVTANRMDVLRMTGLIARQAAIAESIIIMERQLRQAELILELMAVYGPDAPIEIAPGEYAEFSHTPAGRQIAAEIAEAETRARIRLLELEKAEAQLKNNSNDSLAGQSIIDWSAPISTRWPRLLEIFGHNGRLRVSLLVEGEMIRAAVGDRLPNDIEIVAISDKSVILKRGTEQREIAFAR